MSPASVPPAWPPLQHGDITVARLLVPGRRTCDLERGEAGGLAQRVARHAHVEALVPATHILQQQHRVIQL